MGGLRTRPVLLLLLLLPKPDPASVPPAMPSRQKRLIFSVSGLLSFCCALTAAVSTGLPFWLTGTVLCRTGAELVNASGPELEKFLGDLSYGLFHGQRVKQCGLGGRASRFSCEFIIHKSDANRTEPGFTGLMARPGGCHVLISPQSKS